MSDLSSCLLASWSSPVPAAACLCSFLTTSATSLAAASDLRRRVERRQDVGGHRQVALDLEAGAKVDVLADEEVAGVGHRDEQNRFFLGDGTATWRRATPSGKKLGDSLSISICVRSTALTPQSSERILRRRPLGKSPGPRWPAGKSCCSFSLFVDLGQLAVLEQLFPEAPRGSISFAIDL